MPKAPSSEDKDDTIVSTIPSRSKNLINSKFGYKKSFRKNGTAPIKRKTF